MLTKEDLEEIRHMLREELRGIKTRLGGLEQEIEKEEHALEKRLEIIADKVKSSK